MDLEVHLPNGSLLPSGSLGNWAQKHAFQFGVSLAGSYVLYKDPSYYDILEQVDASLIILQWHFIGVEMKRSAGNGGCRAFSTSTRLGT